MVHTELARERTSKIDMVHEQSNYNVYEQRKATGEVCRWRCTAAHALTRKATGEVCRWRCTAAHALTRKATGEVCRWRCTAAHALFNGDYVCICRYIRAKASHTHVHVHKYVRASTLSIVPHSTSVDQQYVWTRVYLPPE